jgi:uncharacterized protein YprB with RNaseH-like and TPR domain
MATQSEATQSEATLSEATRPETTLSDKLRALGVRLGVRDLPPPRRKRFSIEQVVTGRLQATDHGDTFVAETLYPADHVHGEFSLYRGGALGIVAEWATEPCLASPAPTSLAFLDTETTGLGRGPGTYAFLVGVGRWREDTFELAQFFLSDPANESAFLEALTEYLAPCQALVTFNGKGFDVPLLNTRYITNTRPSPLPALAHLDLLPLARRLWRDRLPSRALGSLEQYILGVTRSQEDVPGWMIPQLYFDYMRNGDARPLKNVFYHNAVDVLSMAALLQCVMCMLENPRESADQEPLDLLGIGRLYESLGHVDTAIELYRRALAGALPRDLASQIKERLSLIHKRRENWLAAIALWQEAAAEGEVYACVELAKYWEHRRHDFAEAQRWTLLGFSHAAAPGTSHAARQRWMQELQHRQNRLCRRAARQQSTTPPESVPPAAQPSSDQSTR